jgi:hypothetical protein
MITNLIQSYEKGKLSAEMLISNLCKFIFVYSGQETTQEFDIAKECIFSHLLLYEDVSREVRCVTSCILCNITYIH